MSSDPETTVITAVITATISVFGAVVTIASIVAYVVSRLTKFEVKIDGLAQGNARLEVGQNVISSDVKDLTERVSKSEKNVALIGQRQRMKTNPDVE